MSLNKISNLAVLAFLMHTTYGLCENFPLRIYLVHSSEVLALPNPIELDSSGVGTYSQLKKRVINSFNYFYQSLNNFPPIKPGEIELNCVMETPGQGIMPIRNPADELGLPLAIKACSARVNLGDRFDSSKNMAENIEVLVRGYLSYVENILTCKDKSINHGLLPYIWIKKLALLTPADFEALSENLENTIMNRIKDGLSLTLEQQNTFVSKKYYNDVLDKQLSILKLATGIVSSSQLDAFKTSATTVIDQLFAQGQIEMEKENFFEAVKIWQGLLDRRILSNTQTDTIEKMWKSTLEEFDLALKTSDFAKAQEIYKGIDNFYKSASHAQGEHIYKIRADYIKSHWWKTYLNEITLNFAEKNYHKVFKALECIENTVLFTSRMPEDIVHDLPSTTWDLQLYLVKLLENQIEKYLVDENYDEAARVLLLLSEKEYQGVPLPEIFFRTAYDKFAFRIDQNKANRSLKIPGRSFESLVGVRFISESDLPYDAKNNIFFKIELPVGCSVLELKKAIVKYFEQSPISVCGRYVKPTVEHIIVHAFDDDEYAKLDWYDQDTNKINNDYVISLKIPYSIMFDLETSLTSILRHLKNGEKSKIYPILDQPFVHDNDRTSLIFFSKQIDAILDLKVYSIEQTLQSLSFVENRICDSNISPLVKQKLQDFLNERHKLLQTMSAIQECLEHGNYEKAKEYLDSIITNEIFSNNDKTEAEYFFIGFDCLSYRERLRKAKAGENLKAEIEKIIAEINNRSYTEKLRKIVIEQISEELRTTIYPYGSYLMFNLK